MPVPQSCAQILVNRGAEDLLTNYSRSRCSQFCWSSFLRTPVLFCLCYHPPQTFLHSLCSDLHSKPKRSTHVGRSPSFHITHCHPIPSPFSLCFYEFIKKNLSFSSLQLSVFCSNSLNIPISLPSLQEQLALCFSPKKDLCTHSHDGVSVFLGSAVFHKFRFHVFQPLLATEWPFTGSEMGPIFKKPQNAAEEVRRARACSVLIGFPAQPLPPERLSDLESHREGKEQLSSLLTDRKHTAQKRLNTKPVFHNTSYSKAAQPQAVKVNLWNSAQEPSRDREWPNQTALQGLFSLVYPHSCRWTQRPVHVPDHPTDSLAASLSVWSQPRTAAITGTLHGAGCSWSSEPEGRQALYG